MDPLLLEALREVDRIAPAAPNVAPPDEPATAFADFVQASPITHWSPYVEPPCRAAGAAPADCTHCHEQMRARVRARLAAR